jgi:S1/P1 Nuclease
MSKLGFLTATVTLGLVLCSARARAWDDFGHMEVAAVAYKSLTQKTKKRVAQLLPLNPSYSNWIVGARPEDKNRVAFIRAATWADSIKSSRSGFKNGTKDPQSAATAGQNIGYADTFAHSYWHFVDQPFTQDGTALVQPSAPNAATQIPLFRDTLAAPVTDDLKSYDLVWLLHLVGDVHQPLHCVSRFDQANPSGDRGGNNVSITGNQQPPVCDDPQFCPFGPPDELHAFFDDIAGSGYAVAAVEAAAAKLAPADPQKAAILDEKVWIAEGLELAQSKIYVAPILQGKGPFTITTEYQSAALTLGKQRIALAGARLAKLLNNALGK